MLKTTALLSSIKVAEDVAEKFGNLNLFQEVYFTSRATQGVLGSIKLALEDQGLHGLFLNIMADYREVGLNEECEEGSADPTYPQDDGPLTDHQIEQIKQSVYWSTAYRTGCFIQADKIDTTQPL